ncbi:MAG: efflux transporter, family, subunit [Bryobacterales bacterium]|nr:efflux transporter, family, subunit [Bryobacterales bacterium]
MLAGAVAALGGYRIYCSVRAPHQGSASNSASYRCSMHPNYTSNQPGMCPVCGMRLTRAFDASRGFIGVQISPEEQKRSGIETEHVTRIRPLADVVAPGEIVLGSPEMLKAPVAGTIEKIFLALDGPNSVPVQKGQLILSILPRPGLDAPAVRTEISSPASAWITVSAHPGTVVPAGSVLAFYSTVETLPVTADIPLDSIDLVKKGSSAEMTSDSDPGKTWKGTVTNVLGIYSEQNRAAKVTLVFPNTSLNLRSNMPVHLRIHHSGPPVLAVPEDAVLWSGNRWICYVPQSDSKFVARSLQLGAHSDGFYEVHGGLKLGDAVVAKAAFLVDSESRLRPQIDP